MKEIDLMTNIMARVSFHVRMEDSIEGIEERGRCKVLVYTISLMAVSILVDDRKENLMGKVSLLIKEG